MGPRVLDVISRELEEGNQHVLRRLEMAMSGGLISADDEGVRVRLLKFSGIVKNDAAS